VFTQSRLYGRIQVGIGALVVVAAGLVAATAPGAWRFGIVAVAVAGFAAVADDRIAVPATIVLAWLVVNGFLVDRFGELSWHGRSDLYRAVMLVSAGALGQVVGWTRRLARQRKQRRAFAAEWHLIVQKFNEKETHDA
jgi:hypothetical protein